MRPIRVIMIHIKKQISDKSQIAFSPKYLLYTNIGISFIRASIGDTLAQTYEKYRHKELKWEKIRTLKMGTTGAAMGFFCHYWYKFLDTKLPERTIRVVLKKMLLDELICSPACITLFFIVLGILENSSMYDIWEEMRQKAWKMYLVDWIVSPASQFVNFSFLPTKYRVLYDNAVCLGFDIYNSNLRHKSH